MITTVAVLGSAQLAIRCACIAFDSHTPQDDDCRFFRAAVALTLTSFIQLCMYVYA